MAGRHRAQKKSKPRSRFVKLGSAALVAALIPALTVSSATADERILDAIALCESGNRNVPTGILDSSGKPASSATGYLQIVIGTWKGFGGLEFAPRAMDATREEQFIVGRRILKGQGLGAWEESKACWSKKMSLNLNLNKSKDNDYVIQSGDTLSAIAEKHGVTVRSLLTLNRDTVENPDLIIEGNTLRLR